MEVLTGSIVSSPADEQFAEAVADVGAASRHMIATVLTLLATMREQPAARVSPQWKQQIRAAVDQALARLEAAPEPGQPDLPTLEQLLRAWDGGGLS